MILADIDQFLEHGAGGLEAGPEHQEIAWTQEGAEFERVVHLTGNLLGVNRAHRISAFHKLSSTPGAGKQKNRLPSSGGGS